MPPNDRAMTGAISAGELASRTGSNKALLPSRGALAAAARLAGGDG